MRSALWEASPGALAALLNARGPLTKADLYTLTVGGSPLRWSGFDGAVTVDGNTWSLGPGIQRGRVRSVTGIDVDTLQVTLLTDAARPVTIGGVPLLQYIRQGGLYDARLQLDRAFWDGSAASVTGTLLWFVGRVSDVEIGRYQARLTVRSDLELLNVMVPRDVYQPGCLNTLYDAACGLNRATVQVTGTTTSATDAARLVFSHGLAQATGYFDLGVIQFTSGANAGVSRSVKKHTGSTLSVMQPWPAAVVSGDAFTACPGCDKTRSTCDTKFSNVIRFRGHPYIPMPETVV